ncbi:MAG: hypothetical protein HOE90_08250 [Bacteriovoracaceae bacterium]|jgi:hypothetical protein|nr:hypothetical protein [Bacteriovoracaceae bacterium]
MEGIDFSKEDIKDFKNWLNLNWEGVTWYGKFEGEFNTFWDATFAADIKLNEIVRRIDYIKSLIKSGPLTAWFDWLKHKCVCYTFIFKSISILDLSRFSGIDEDEIGLLLRDAFVDILPQHEDYLNEKFHIGTIISENIYLNMDEIKEDLNLGDYFRGSSSDEIMVSLEVTLYEEWNKIIRHIENEFREDSPDLKKYKRKLNARKQFRVVQDFVILSIIGVLLISGVKFINKYYEKHLSDKISIFEPDFLWLDKTLTFKERTELASESTEDIKKLEDIENAESLGFGDAPIEEERYETESEVSVTSWDELPRDLEASGFEQSEYEEVKKGGIRDSSYGNRKVYRVMVKSIDPDAATVKLKNLLEEYHVGQVDNVKPGTNVPGGVYYNLYVPIENMREFLAEVEYVDDSMVFESRTRWRNPPGKNRVFIWLKKI